MSKERSAYLLIIVACSSTPETCDSFLLWPFFIFFFFDGCLIYPVFATSQEEIQVVCVSLEVDFLPSGIK